MNKLLSLFVILLSFSLLTALEFTVEDFELNPLDMKGNLDSVQDANGDDCALIKVETDAVSEIHFVQVEVAKKVNESPGVYYFYISFRERQVKITAENYMPMNFKFPIGLESRKVYTLKLKSSGEVFKEEDLVTVVVSVKPLDCNIAVDGVEMNTKIFKLVKGIHNISISKEGYISRTEDYDFQLDEQINFELFPGRHEIVVEKINYKTQIRTINFTEDQTLFFDLVKNVAIANINIPEYCKLYIDGVETKKMYGIELSPGSYNVRISNPVGEDVADVLIVNDLATIDRTYEPKVKTGIIDIEVYPYKNTTVTLTDALGQKHSKVGGAYFNDICIGNYTIECTKEGFEEYRHADYLYEGEVKKHQFNLKELEGEGTLTVNVSPTHAKVKVVSDKNGKTYSASNGKSLEKLPVGKYKIYATAKGYTKKNTSVTIKKNESQNTSISLRERGFRVSLNNTLRSRFLYIGGIEHHGRDFEDEFSPSDIFDTENIEGNTLLFCDDIYANMRLKYGVIGVKADASVSAKLYRKAKTHYPIESVETYEDAIMYGNKFMRGELFFDMKGSYIAAKYGRLASINRYALIHRYGGIGYQLEMRANPIELNLMYTSPAKIYGYSDDIEDITDFETDDESYLSITFLNNFDKNKSIYFGGITDDNSSLYYYNFESKLGELRGRFGYGNAKNTEQIYVVDLGFQYEDEHMVELGFSMASWEKENETDREYSIFAQNALRAYFDCYYFLSLKTNPLEDSLDNANDNTVISILEAEEYIIMMPYFNLHFNYYGEFMPYWTSTAMFTDSGVILEIDVGAEIVLVKERYNRLVLGIQTAFLHQHLTDGDTFENDESDWRYFTEENLFGIKTEISWRIW